MKKLKDAVIIPRKLLGEILISNEDKDKLIWHLLRYGLDLEEANPDYYRYEYSLDRANCEASQRELLSEEEYERIIAHLNRKTGKHLLPTSKENRKWMNRPIAAGFTVEDEIKVIDIMCERWLSDKKMHQYLRPETLFGSKFEGYLNADSDNKRESSFEIDSFFEAALERAYEGKNEW